MRHRVELRGDDEIGLLSSAGAAVAAALTDVSGRILPGVFPADLERAAVASLTECGAAPAVPIPGGGARALSLSRNDVVCGGPPAGEWLRAGELVTVECAASVAGWCAWSALGTSVGVPAESDLRLTETAAEALRSGIAAVSVGNRLGEVAHAIGVVARGAGCGMPVGCGYGIGRRVCEGPVVPAPGKRSTGVALRPGLVFTVAAGVCDSGSDEGVRGQDGVVTTGDGSRACVFGHTVAVTRWGPRVLTSS
ncbi:methionyl aminopeptidase [Actinopolyspora lacussalsi subsp. righensis]|uniref:Methionyl aminopeptidase n=1 Tax=Actinopolyspora righensis TaxID=995060 RepID=A0A1I6X3N1_9ACTN|nr:M24 family metallopeptidase [Actinopolyspora righensis]SFT32424.1 methionyl aminopeptidase [Actinopolyspora righensis]